MLILLKILQKRSHVQRRAYRPFIYGPSRNLQEVDNLTNYQEQKYIGRYKALGAIGDTKQNILALFYSYDRAIVLLAGCGIYKYDSERRYDNYVKNLSRSSSCIELIFGESSHMKVFIIYGKKAFNKTEKLLLYVSLLAPDHERLFPA